MSDINEFVLNLAQSRIEENERYYEQRKQAKNNFNIAYYELLHFINNRLNDIEDRDIVKMRLEYLKECMYQM